MSWTLAGKKVLITGGTKGIGRATAQEMLDLGAEVLVVARETKSIEGKLRHSARLFVMPGDIVDASFRADLIQRIQDNWGVLDVLVNNVGTNLRKNFVDYTPEEIQTLFDINLFSLTDLTQRAFNLLCQSQQASVINVASVAGRWDVRSGPPYGMTKAAIIQLSRHLAVEWAPFGIRVNSVSPWYTQTPLTESVLQNPERLEQITHRTPLARVAQPEEVAAAIAFLAMDKASYVTGHNLVVDGGMGAKGL